MVHVLANIQLKATLYNHLRHMESMRSRLISIAYKDMLRANLEYKFSDIDV